MHILVVEDERILCETIARSLKRLAYSVDCCYDGITAMQMLADDNFDLVVLDLNLPDADGMTVLRTLRKTDRDTKVLILSARSEVSDKVDGLDAGANDYLAKPFHLEELAARIRSLTLRQFTQNDVVLTCGDVSFDTKSRKAIVGGEPLPLTRKETGILEYLMVNRGMRAQVDDRNEKIGRKIRDNELKRIPYLVIVGEKEEAEGKVSIRVQGEGDKGQMTLEEYKDYMVGLVKAEMEANKIEK